MNVVDLLIAGFIFLLFVSIYKKRDTPAVRLWVVGWFFVLLHFGALAFRPHSVAGDVTQSIVALGTLILCGTSFALSHPEAHATARRQVWVGLLLGGPWLMTIVLGSLPNAHGLLTVCCALLSVICAIAVALRLLPEAKARFAVVITLAGGCAVWLMTAPASEVQGTAQCVVLTLCFGLNAILLIPRRSRLSVATVTTSVGAIAWASVWGSSTILHAIAPNLALSPEVWNLPKYFVAAGMVLSLLEGEIRSAELASEEYRLLFAGNPHPMWSYESETLRILEVNEAAVAHYGYSRDEFKAMTLADVMGSGTHEDVLAEFRAVAPQQLTGPWLHRCKDGSEFQVDIASHSVVREGRRVTFALIHDVTEPQRLHARLIRQAHHDVLTDLPNRALFEHRLQEVVLEAKANGHQAAVFCIDLDRFKQINDTFGHEAGDQCLCEMAQRITARLQGAGTLARTGGDEFMLVLGQLTEEGEAEQLASQFLDDLKPSISVEGGEVELVASIGIAVYPDDGQDETQLWRDADAAMYLAKRAGGSQWVRVSREISASVTEVNEIELSLRRSLRNQEFYVVYQPQMTADGRLHSFEALVRSSDPLLAKTSPERFVAIAEESGLIVSLGDFVLEEVCRQVRSWADVGRETVQVAVNVSPLQLVRADFSRKVAEVLDRYGLSPKQLEFEVTESTMMSDRGDAPHQIATLARMGIRFSVDDFGTGYSSLGRLHQLPVSSLKIDCSFTKRIAERKGTYPTVRAIIALAHTFGMKVVAEGVETDEQLRTLRSLECDRMQGYLFSRPITADQAVDLLPMLETELLKVSVA